MKCAPYTVTGLALALAMAACPLLAQAASKTWKPSPGAKVASDMNFPEQPAGVETCFSHRTMRPRLELRHARG